MTLAHKLAGVILASGILSACSASIIIDPATSENYCTTMTQKAFEKAVAKPKAVAAGRVGAVSFKSYMRVADKNDEVMPVGITRKHLKIAKNVYLQVKSGGAYLYTKAKTDVVATIKDGKIICGPAQLAES